VTVATTEGQANTARVGDLLSQAKYLKAKRNLKHQRCTLDWIWGEKCTTFCVNQNNKPYHIALKTKSQLWKANKDIVGYNVEKCFVLSTYPWLDVYQSSI
jgi:hypothetical protein